MSKIRMTLIAIGNRNMGDDGIGPVLLEEIKRQLADDIEVHIWESKDALSVAAELLEIHNPIVIIDCADMGLNGGDFKWFNRAQCLLENHFELLSTHGFGFAEALALVEQLGFKQELYFFALQPVVIGFAQPISSGLYNKIPSLTNELLKRLNQLCDLPGLLQKEAQKEE
ncbi:MAG: hydrogenase maturation protease [Thiotrichaceae bacterium]|nr:hydrogenase maturation protease [Thiotrichaceae bacterium]